MRTRAVTEACANAALEKVLDGRPIRQPDPTLRPPVVMPLPASDLAGRHVVVTAGGTAEAIDPVRYVGNRSTGKMGVAIATSAPHASPQPISSGSPFTYFSDTRELIHGSAGGSGLAVVNASGQASYGFTFNMPTGATPGQTVANL